MNFWLFLIPSLAVVQCRPQSYPDDIPTVEIEKQELIEIKPRQLFENSANDSTRKQLEDSTKEILEKIARVNEKQGLNKKKIKPTYHQFPYSFLRSQDDRKEQRADFKFPRNPFTNPIFEYMKNNDEAKKRTPVVESDDDEISGQYIKRKIIHQQSILVPSSYAYSPNVLSQFLDRPSQENQKDELEKQTVDNIKNIVGNSQFASMGAQPLVTSYHQALPAYQLYGPYSSEELNRPAAKQFQWPLAQYFPIIIKDPLMHMFNAMTTMIEYGPQASAGGANACKKESEEDKSRARNIDNTKHNSVDSDKPKLTYSIEDNGHGPEITISNDDNSTTILEIEDLEITTDASNRQSKQTSEAKKTVIYNSTTSMHSPLLQETSRQSPPIRDQVLEDDEVAEDDVQKAEDVQVSHDGNKKLFSKDNTGSGIFVHKIKVRKGGVAIAGPGGIATAGSGGTAIVGPNGFAYTQPDSLAIAGSGTKVVAVDPTINLSEIIIGHNRNKTRGQGHAPPRVGKVVAVGPVIYYNRG